jgi:NitT/TauT family transport system permease protein
VTRSLSANDSVAGAAVTPPDGDFVAKPILANSRFARARAGKISNLIIGTILPVSVVALWYLVVQLKLFPSGLIPSPTTVIGTIGDWAFSTKGRAFYSGKLVSDFQATFVRVVAGFAVASACGVLVGVAIGFYKRAETFFSPLLRILGPVPPITWIPVIIVVLHIGETSNIFLTFLGGFFPVVNATAVAVGAVSREQIRAGRMMGFGTGRLIASVVLPAAFPGIVGGLRLSLGMSWMMAVTSEMLAVPSGMGYTLWNAYNYMDYPGVFSAMALIGLCGLASDLLLQLVTRRALRWQTDTGVRN